MIRAVVFDFGQTLVDSAEGFRTAEKEIQQKAVAALGLDDWEGFLDSYRGIRSAFHARSEFSRRAILEGVFRHCGRVPDPALLEVWEAGYWEKIHTMTSLFPETEEILQALQGRGYRLALITNAQGQMVEGKHRIGRYPRLASFFEAIVVAGEGGIPAKPDPTPFRICLEKMRSMWGTTGGSTFSAPGRSECTPSGCGTAPFAETGPRWRQGGFR